MNMIVESVLLRRPELHDCDALYEIKNDVVVASSLGGFHVGMSTADIKKWVEIHNGRSDEVVWVVADRKSNECIGHAGIYKIDHRVRLGEFAILLSKNRWGEGIGSNVTQRVIEFGFRELNLNRLSLTVLEENERARRVYEKLGFVQEGILRQTQYKGGQYHNLVCYSVLREEADVAAH